MPPKAPRAQRARPSQDQVGPVQETATMNKIAEIKIQEQAYTNTAIELAKKLLNTSKSAKSEIQNVQIPLYQLIETLTKRQALQTSIQFDVYAEAPILGKRMDVYCPQARLVAETKAPATKGASGASQLRKTQAQVAKYITLLRNQQIQKPLFNSQLDNKRPWTEIITDGIITRIREWDHSPNSSPKPETQLHKGNTTPEKFVEILSEKLTGKPSALPWIPDDIASLYEDTRASLKEIHDYLQSAETIEVETAQKLWFRTLQSTGMTPKDEEKQKNLFLTHCHLLYITEAIIEATSGNSQQNHHQHEGFHLWIQQVEDQQANNYLKEIKEITESYEWQFKTDDILNILYMKLIPEEDQMTFGKFYTPNWLASAITDHLISDEWIEGAIPQAREASRNQQKLKNKGILDPTCGSGTFLLAAIDKIKNAEAVQKLKLNQDEFTDIISQLIYGIDADPIAVALAKANIIRILGPSSIGKTNIYLGDSLIIDKKITGTLELEHDYTFTSSLGMEVALPNTFMKLTEFQKMARRLVDAANPHEKATYEDHQLDKLLKNSRDQQLLKRAHDQITEIIEKEGNSIWAWYIIQNAGIQRLTNSKVDRILANPPWVTLKEVSNQERRDKMEQLAGRPYKKIETKTSKKSNGKTKTVTTEKQVQANSAESLAIWNIGKQGKSRGLANTFDIAQIFLKRTKQLYLTGNGQAGLLTNKSAITGNNWKTTRETEGTRWKYTIDLAEFNEKPFTRDSCAIIIDETNKEPTKNKKAQAVEYVSKTESYSEAKRFITITNTEPMIAKPSDYADEPRAGAKLDPQALVRVDRVLKTDNNKKTKFVSTLRPSKAKWPVPSQKVTIPSHWLIPVFQANQILPFASDQRNKRQAIVPCNNNQDEIIKDKNRQSKESKSYQKLNELYEEHRTEAVPPTLAEKIDFNGVATKQLKERKIKCHKVAYNKSGGSKSKTSLRACLAPSKTLTEDKIYTIKTKTRDEALYLLSIINAPTLQKTFQAMKNSPLHFDKTPFTKVPIPRYDPKNKNHAQLAQLAKQANKQAQAKLRTVPITTKPEQAQNIIYNDLLQSGILEQIDTVVRRLLPAYAT